MANSIYTYQSIAAEECMGDSLFKINNNNFQADNAIGVLEDRIQDLNSLINTLSSNMDQIMNVPYARLYEDLTTAGVSIGTSYANRVYAGLIETGPISIITNLGSGNFQFKSTGTYDVKVVAPTHTSAGYQTNTLTTVRLAADTNTVLIKQGRLTGYWAIDAYNQDTDWLDLSDFGFTGRIIVNSTSTTYSVQQLASTTFGAPQTLLGGQAEFWKVN